MHATPHHSNPPAQPWPHLYEVLPFCHFFAAPLMPHSSPRVRWQCCLIETRSVRSSSTFDMKVLPVKPISLILVIVSSRIPKLSKKNSRSATLPFGIIGFKGERLVKFADTPLATNTMLWKAWNFSPSATSFCCCCEGGRALLFSWEPRAPP